MAAAVLLFLRWFPGREAIVRIHRSSLSAATDGHDGGEDRISAHHDDLLRDIVSRLPARDAAHTAALASRWRHLWSSTPLVFHDAHLLSSQDSAAAVDRVLAAHPGPFATVSIGYCDLGRNRELAEWPRLLAAKGVRDLVLVNAPADLDRLPDAPADVLRCASLRRLFLGYFRFPGAAAGTDGLPHLQELSLFGAEMPDGRDLDHLLARCPVLEKLAVVFSEKFQRVVHLRSQSVKCAVLWFCNLEEVAVVDSPQLERLILWGITAGEEDVSLAVRLNIAAAPKLQVLGYLETRVHQLQIGDNVIKADMKPSPSAVVPSVKILALRVNFGVLKEVKMLASFLRCFPNVDMLHIESILDYKPTERHNAKFWRELHPIECLESHVTKMIIHGFRGDRSEFEFVKFVARSAKELLGLLVAATVEKFALADEMDELTTKVEALFSQEWARDECMVLVGGPTVENVWSFRKASDLSVRNPFH